MSIQDLVGLKIADAFWHDGNIYLVGAEPGTGPYRSTARIAELSTEGDCCAHAYIQHVNNPEALFGGTVRGVENLEVTDEANAKALDEYRAEHEGYDPEALDVWGHRIDTDLGTCVIDCRTDHNGYYGGWCNLRWVDAVPGGALKLEER